LTDPDTTGIEKFQSILMGLSLGVGMLLPGLSSLATINNELKIAIVAENAAESKNLIVRGLNRVATWGQVAANEAENVTLWQSVKAWIAVKVAAFPVIAVFAAIAAAIAGVTLIIYGIVKAIKTAEAAKPENQLATAKEEANNLAEALDNA
jgi:hypothetical protein